MSDVQMQRILDRTPVHPRYSPNAVKALTEETKGVYRSSMKRAIMDFCCEDPVKRARLEEITLLTVPFVPISKPVTPEYLTVKKGLEETIDS